MTQEWEPQGGAQRLLPAGNASVWWLCGVTGNEMQQERFPRALCRNRGLLPPQAPWFSWMFCASLWMLIRNAHFCKTRLGGDICQVSFLDDWEDCHDCAFEAVKPLCNHTAWCALDQGVRGAVWAAFLICSPRGRRLGFQPLYFMWRECVETRNGRD